MSTILKILCLNKIKSVKKKMEDSLHLKADNLSSLDYLPYFMSNNYYLMTGSIDDYVNGRPASKERIIRYYLTLALHLAYTLRWALLRDHHDDQFLTISGEFLHNYFKIKTLANALLYVALLFVSILIIAHYFELRHNIKYLDILHKIRTKSSDCRLTAKEPEEAKRLLINSGKGIQEFLHQVVAPFHMHFYAMASTQFCNQQ